MTQGCLLTISTWLRGPSSASEPFQLKAEFKPLSLHLTSLHHFFPCTSLSFVFFKVFITTENNWFLKCVHFFSPYFPRQRDFLRVVYHARLPSDIKLWTLHWNHWNTRIKKYLMIFLFVCVFLYAWRMGSHKHNTAMKLGKGEYWGIWKSSQKS